VSPADLELAKEHLAACDGVGLTERMSESIELLACSLQTRPFGEVSSANRTPGRPPLAALDEATTAALVDLTARDRELYAFACEMFEERRRAMTRRLFVLGPDRARPAAERALGVPSPVFTFDGPIPGDGWYAPERSGERWLLTAAVPRALMAAPGEGNRIAIRLPRVIRPCEQDPAADDSRLLGIAVHRIELAGIEP
jgi:hypothetical protein